MAYRILTFDGGGIRGIYTAVLLQRLQKEVPGFIGKSDILAGTSTGGIIALGLAAGYTPAKMVSLYRKNGAKIFDDSIWDDMKDMGGLIGAEYGNKNLKKMLKQYFGMKKLKSLKMKVLIPSFDIGCANLDRGIPAHPWKPKFYHNFAGPDSDGDEYVVDVAMCTSAAPTYFPSYHGYIDGGTVANNPSVAAIAQARSKEAGSNSLDDIVVLSLGTGTVPTNINRGMNLDWGYTQWAKPLINLMIDGVMGVADYQCKQLLADRYKRLSPKLKKDIKLDSVKDIPLLIKYANNAKIKTVVDWIKKYWE